MARLSTHTDQATASRVSEMAKLEDRTPSQIMAAPAWGALAIAGAWFATHLPGPHK